MRTVNEVLQERNARRYRQLAFAIAVLLHTLVIGALVYYADAENIATSKEEVANLDKTATKPLP